MSVYVHCMKCDHEWKLIGGGNGNRICDWCGGESYILESATPHQSNPDHLERIITNLKEKDNPLSQSVLKKILKHGIKEDE